MISAVVVINPLSGRGRYDDQVEADAAIARSVLAAHGIAATVHPTTASGDAHRFAREAIARSIDLVIAWGGDGTINEVASALIHTPVPLAIIPAGSGNGLAGDLGVPEDPATGSAAAALGGYLAARETPPTSSPLTCCAGTRSSGSETVAWSRRARTS